MSDSIPKELAGKIEAMKREVFLLQIHWEIYLRIHDLRHTYGRKLHSAGVSFEDRQDLLGHKLGRITIHYSAPELINLIQASKRICANERCKSDTIVYLPHAKWGTIARSFQGDKNLRATRLRRKASEIARPPHDSG